MAGGPEKQAGGGARPRHEADEVRERDAGAGERRPEDRDDPREEEGFTQPESSAQKTPRREGEP